MSLSLFHKWILHAWNTAEFRLNRLLSIADKEERERELTGDQVLGTLSAAESWIRHSDSIGWQYIDFTEGCRVACCKIICWCRLRRWLTTCAHLRVTNRPWHQYWWWRFLKVPKIWSNASHIDPLITVFSVFGSVVGKVCVKSCLTAFPYIQHLADVKSINAKLTDVDNHVTLSSCFASSLWLDYSWSLVQLPDNTGL